MEPHDALAWAVPKVFWLDRPERPLARASLRETVETDLVVVGGGYGGLWAALQSVEDDPTRRVVLIEATRIGGEASGRNGGFCSSSLTHGLANGLARFPHEIDHLERLGRQNLDGIEATVRREGIECSFERTGNLIVATRPHHLHELPTALAQELAHGGEGEWLERDRVRAEVDSPTYLGGYWRRRDEALVDPARLAWGLARACERAGVEIYEHTPMVSLDQEGPGVVVRTPRGSVRAGAAILATNAFPVPVPAIRRRVVPVYDYVLATEPLTDAQMERIGWQHRQGVSDATNLFHYYRLTDDRRIIWGGYDAVYHFGGRISPRLEQAGPTHLKLVRHFQETFPQLTDVRFTHRWAGVIDTSSRFAVSFGTTLGGRVSYAVGYTGLGVGATRFGARVCLDLLYHPDSELLTLDLVRTRPVPFPPEPLRWLGITWTRRALERADRRSGRRGPWLRLLDRVGLGFDS